MSALRDTQQLVNEYIEEIEALNGVMMRQIEEKVGFDTMKSLIAKEKIFAQSGEGEIHPFLAYLLLYEKEDITDVSIRTEKSTATQSVCGARYYFDTCAEQYSARTTAGHVCGRCFLSQPVADLAGDSAQSDGPESEY